MSESETFIVLQSVFILVIYTAILCSEVVPDQLHWFALVIYFFMYLRRLLHCELTSELMVASSRHILKKSLNETHYFSSLMESISHVVHTGVMERWVTRLQQPWLSASCPPAAAPLSSAGLSTLGVWLAPPALRRSVPQSSLACTALENHRHLMTAITTRHQTPMCPMMTKSTARRRTSSRRRRKEVRIHNVV